MNRQRKVTDLYDAVKSITDEDVFQHVIDSEPDDNVVADLQKRFWDGKSDEPWQVVEINRLLKKRDDRRKSPKSKDGAEEGGTSQAAEKRQSLKERIENNLVVFFLSALVVGFAAGVGAYQTVLEIINYKPVSAELFRQLQESAAKKSGEVAVNQTVTKPIKHLIYSEPTEYPARVRFVNSSNQELDLVWIDTSGGERQFKRLGAGDTHVAATYMSTLWLVKSAASGEQMLLLEPLGTQVVTATVDISTQ